eukprot:GILJ01007861.1.p1 GENE.GILJ01007861.1~~GILJ01007861.1.p1  ORF type:complete len:376 (+),score=43.83 GILJ01007861.1:51-1130(+)
MSRHLVLDLCLPFLSSTPDTLAACGLLNKELNAILKQHLGVVLWKQCLTNHFPLWMSISDISIDDPRDLQEALEFIRSVESSRIEFGKDGLEPLERDLCVRPIVRPILQHLRNVQPVRSPSYSFLNVILYLVESGAMLEVSVLFYALEAIKDSSGTASQPLGKNAFIKVSENICQVIVNGISLLALETSVMLSVLQTSVFDLFESLHEIRTKQACILTQIINRLRADSVLSYDRFWNVFLEWTSGPDGLMLARNVCHLSREADSDHDSFPAHEARLGIQLVRDGDDRMVFKRATGSSSHESSHHSIRLEEARSGFDSVYEAYIRVLQDEPIFPVSKATNQMYSRYSSQYDNESETLLTG